MDVYVKTCETADDVVDALQLPDDNATEDKIDE